MPSIEKVGRRAKLLDALVGIARDVVDFEVLTPERKARRPGEDPGSVTEAVRIVGWPSITSVVKDCRTVVSRES